MNALTTTLEGEFGPKMQFATKPELLGFMSCIVQELETRYKPRTAEDHICDCIGDTETDQLLMVLAAIAYRIRFPIKEPSFIGAYETDQ
jgi:hypothetical protein